MLYIVTVGGATVTLLRCTCDVVTITSYTREFTDLIHNIPKDTCAVPQKHSVCKNEKNNNC